MQSLRPLLVGAHAIAAPPSLCHVAVVAKNLKTLREVVANKPRNDGGTSHGPKVFRSSTVDVINGKKQHFTLATTSATRGITAVMRENLHALACVVITPMRLCARKILMPPSTGSIPQLFSKDGVFSAFFSPYFAPTGFALAQPTMLYAAVRAALVVPVELLCRQHFLATSAPLGIHTPLIVLDATGGVQ